MILCLCIHTAVWSKEAGRGSEFSGGGRRGGQEEDAERAGECHTERESQRRRERTHRETERTAKRRDRGHDSCFAERKTELHRSGETTEEIWSGTVGNTEKEGGMDWMPGWIDLGMTGWLERRIYWINRWTDWWIETLDGWMEVWMGGWFDWMNA